MSADRRHCSTLEPARGKVFAQTTKKRRRSRDTAASHYLVGSCLPVGTFFYRGVATIGRGCGIHGSDVRDDTTGCSLFTNVPGASPTSGTTPQRRQQQQQHQQETTTIKRRHVHEGTLSARKFFQDVQRLERRPWVSFACRFGNLREK